MSSFAKRPPRKTPQCTSVNSIGFRCGHNALYGLLTCGFHSTKEEKETAFKNKAIGLTAAKEDREIFPTQLRILENSGNAKDLANAVLSSLDFAEYITEGLRTRTISPMIIIRLMDYAEGFGKPTERVEHSGDTVVTEVRRVVVRTKEETTEETEPFPSLESSEDDGVTH